MATSLKDTGKHSHAVEAAIDDEYESPSKVMEKPLDETTILSVLMGYFGSDGHTRKKIIEHGCLTLSWSITPLTTVGAKGRPKRLR